MDESTLAGILWQNGDISVFSGYPGFETVSQGANSAGLVVGNSVVSSNYHHAAKWEYGTFTDLGSLAGSSYGSGASSVNENGWIAGSTQVTLPSALRAIHPFAYRP